MEGDSPSKVRIKAVPLPHQSTSANLIGLIMRPCYHGPRLPPKWKVSNRGSLYRLASHPATSGQSPGSLIFHDREIGFAAPSISQALVRKANLSNKRNYSKRCANTFPQVLQEHKSCTLGRLSTHQKATPGAKPGFSVDKLTVSFLPQILTAEK